MELKEVINYRGYDINIYYDDDPFMAVDNGADYVFIVYDHRQFYVKVEGFDPEDIYDHWKDGNEAYDNHWVFPLYAYIHSGVALSLAKDHYPFTDRWDVSFRGFVLASKEGFTNRDKAYQASQSYVQRWNDMLLGKAYGFQVEGEGYEDSCWGFIGDDDYKYMLEEAKAGIDNQIKRKIKEHGKQVKDYIKKGVPIIYRKPSFVNKF
jgi:hypothetical protein